MKHVCRHDDGGHALLVGCLAAKSWQRHKVLARRQHSRFSLYELCWHCLAAKHPKHLSMMTMSTLSCFWMFFCIIMLCYLYIYIWTVFPCPAQLDLFISNLFNFFVLSSLYVCVCYVNDVFLYINHHLPVDRQWLCESSISKLIYHNSIEIVLEWECFVQLKYSIRIG